MSYFKHHVFLCTNQRSEGECCAVYGSEDARNYMKKRCKALGIHGAGMVRINKAGCLDRCSRGPVMVIYPAAVWYTWVDREDLDEIIERHLVAGEQVARLRLSGM
mgnify:FL=1